MKEKKKKRLFRVENLYFSLGNIFVLQKKNSFPLKIAPSQNKTFCFTKRPPTAKRKGRKIPHPFSQTGCNSALFLFFFSFFDNFKFCKVLPCRSDLWD